MVRIPQGLRPLDRGLSHLTGADRTRRDSRHRGVITTISRGGAGVGVERSQKRKVESVLVMRGKANTTLTLVITFSERDMRYKPPKQDEPMVISVVAVKYKVERVLIDHGSSANILYWSTYKKLGLPPTDLDPYTGKLYGFAGEQVAIKGVIELETTFGEHNHTRTILVLYSVVDVEASYSIIMGRPALNRPDLKEVNVRPNTAHKTKVGTALVQKDESRLVSFLWENWDVFAWSLIDMPGIDPRFLCHHPSILPCFRSMIAKARRRKAKGGSKGD
ncbi:hypothetical protein CR513_25081, partial [Mucuna pruriens]